jgi:hypothetical protein
VNYRTFALTVCVAYLGCNGALAAAADAKDAKAQREKPLQRCDELADKAQLDCLAKARERVLEARKKRESSADRTNAGKAAAPRKSEEKTAPSK